MAGPFPQDFIESVRNTGDIVRWIADYVPLKQSGSRMKGLCPFHQEKTPSFSVDPERQLFYCFGCQAGGDLFKFVQMYEKVPFGESVEMVAKRYGVPLPARTGRKPDALERMFELNRTAETFFRNLLADPGAGVNCRAYVARRGLSDETAERLGLGYAPDAWEGLRSYLIAKSYKPEELQRAGFVLDRKSGSGQYDRFRDRLIFPIRDVNGRTVAFGGRSLGDAEPKYLNSPETPTYKKGDHLYGLDLSREAIRREGFAIVVEGYLDLAALLQAGFDNVVASLGTAFTATQARLLARTTTRVVFSYDGDSAGAKATARSLDLLLAQGFEVRVVELPGGRDPDDYVKDNGAAAYRALLQQAPGYIEFLIHRETRTRNIADASEKVAAINALLPHLTKLQNAVERAQWGARLADALQVDDDLVLQELRAAVRSNRESIRQRATNAPVTLKQAEAFLVLRLMSSVEEQERWRDELDPADLEGTGVAGIVNVILGLAREGLPADYPAVLELLETQAEQDLLTRIAFSEQPEEGPGVEDCLCAFQRQRLTREGKQVLREIGSLQRDSEGTTPVDVDQQLLRLQELARRRDALH